MAVDAKPPVVQRPATMALASLAQRPTIPLTEAARDRTSPGKVTGKLLVALNAMIWEGKKRSEAAAIAGISEHSLYKALRRPPVRAHYLREIEVLRTSGKARRIHRLEELSEQDDNKQAAINAIRALDQLEDDASISRRTGFAASPGFIINIINAPGQGDMRAPNVREAERPMITTHGAPLVGERSDE